MLPATGRRNKYAGRHNRFFYLDIYHRDILYGVVDTGNSQPARGDQLLNITACGNDRHTRTGR